MKHYFLIFLTLSVAFLSSCEKNDDPVFKPIDDKNFSFRSSHQMVGNVVLPNDQGTIEVAVPADGLINWGIQTTDPINTPIAPPADPTTDFNGEANTANIVTAYTGVFIYPDGNYAAKKCTEIGEGWYLPAAGEVQAIYTNLSDELEAIDGPFNQFAGYWTSTEMGDSHAWVKSFFNGAFGGGFKVYKHNTVCARKVELQCASDLVADLKDQFNFSYGGQNWANGFNSKLNDAIQFLQSNNSFDAISKLNAFINQVNGKRNAGQISEGDAYDLIAVANAIIAFINDGGCLHP